MTTTYTAITFAPVQSFIEKSRKLRDLYGSSFLLSYLSKVICEIAERDPKCRVVSPAIIDITQGTPNQIIIKGDFDEDKAKEAFNKAWQTIVTYCRKYIEAKVPNFNYTWSRHWKAWENYAWEFFYAKSTLADVQKEPNLTIITHARRKLNQVKLSRNWTGINWQGESSTLSGADAIAYPGMGIEGMTNQNQGIEKFYRELSNAIGDKIIDATEYLSIPELVKRLITLDPVIENLNETIDVKIKTPKKFSDLNRQSDNSEDNHWTAWFQGDGDSIGKYLRGLTENKQNQSPEELTSSEADNLNNFSRVMLDWGKGLENKLPRNSVIKKGENVTDYPQGRIIYAGGDDFFGVFYRNQEINNDPQPELKPQQVLKWFYRFDPDVWDIRKTHNIQITVSVGLVWAGHGVPQRDILQHCREAEKLAKKKGRNRLAIRILFNSGNYLDWVCPWWFLKPVLEGDQQQEVKRSWSHFYNDIHILQSRHAFSNNNSDLALGLFEIYFGMDTRKTLKNNLWNSPKSTKKNIHQTGILGNKKDYRSKADRKAALNNWIISLSQVGFHLFTSLSPEPEGKLSSR
jgi:CRISPR-associated protein Cmr2